MIIKELTVTGYKNLIDCKLRPTGVHAITGSNGTGKSNLLEVLAFVVLLHTGSDEKRSAMMAGGIGVGKGSTWFPISRRPETTVPFHFTLDAIVSSDGEQYLVRYSLSFEQIDKSNRTFFRASRISHEEISVKAVGAPGRPKTMLTRDATGKATAYAGKTKRSEMDFKCKSDMSALQALEIREADDFSSVYPVLAEFRNDLLSTEIIRLDPESFKKALYNPSRANMSQRVPGMEISSFDPFFCMEAIKSDKSQWVQFRTCMKDLMGLDDLVLYDSEKELKDNSEVKHKFIFPHKHGRLLMNGELSMGNTVLLAYLTVMYNLLNKGGAALFEEPENHLHPKAVIDLISLFREFSDRHTVIFTTHSPVALNSMVPEEVSVMRELQDGFVTIQSIAEISDAVHALDRGFLSFGDLLQTNYEAE